MKTPAIFKILAVFTAFFVAPVHAQNAGTVTAHAFALGKGAGTTGYTSLLCTSAQLAVGQSAADPICKTITGDVTISAAGVTAIGSAKVTAAMIASMTSAQLRTILSDESGTGIAYFQGGALGTPSSATLTNATGLPVGGLASQAANTIVANATGSSASPTAIDISTLTAKASPASSDLLLISDQAASGALKKATISSIASAGSVSSIDSKTGAFTTGNGLNTSTNVIELTAARRTLPTSQLLTASSGTYTTPSNVLWIEVYMLGGTGGGGGTGSAGATSAGGAGGDSCWNTSGSACTTPVYKSSGGSGGALGSTTTSANGGAGGSGGTSGGGSSTPTISSAGVDGHWGSPGVASAFSGRGGKGGVTQCGPVLLAGGDGSTGISGGGGGGGGGGPACTYFIIGSPAASYTFANGAAGAAGAAGTGGSAGSAGQAGKILVIEHYGS